MTPPFLGRSEQSIALDGLTPATAVVAAVPDTSTLISRQSWTPVQRRAALTLAGHATDPDDLRLLLRVCGLLDASRTEQLIQQGPRA